MPSLLSRLQRRIARPLLTPLRNELAATNEALGSAYATTDRDTAEVRALRYQLLDATGAVARLTGERDTLRARLDALAPKARGVVPEARRMAILRAVDVWGGLADPTAISIADFLLSSFGHSEPPTSIARWVSDVAAEGWIVSNGKKPARYALTDKGRACLDGGVVGAVAS